MYRGLSALVMSLTLAACGGADPSSADDTASARELPTATRSTTLVAQPTNTDGRLLASNCFQCHGTLGLGGFDNIRGSDANEVLEFMTKTASQDIMAAHAQGYTTEQLKKIIAYLQR
jgi:mono/diheme cytochrome c family protein